MDNRFFSANLALTLLFSMLFYAGNIQAEPRLLYPQEQALKSISNKVTRMVKQFKTYQSLHEKKEYTKKPEPGLGIEKELAEVIAEFEKSDLPADHQKVKNIKSWIDSLQTNLPILEKYYNEGYKAYQVAAKSSDKSNFPDYDADVERLKAMYKNYKNPKSAFANAEKAKEIVPQFNDEYAFYQDLPNKYAAMIKAKKAKTLETWLKTNAKYLDGFREYRDEYATELPGLIETTLDEALAMAEKARDNKKPAFFKGGVKQKLDKASDLLSVYEAIKGSKDSSVSKLAKSFDGKRSSIDAIENSMAAELLASTKAPADSYKGSDKGELMSLVKGQWQKHYPSDDILAIRFHNNNWKRTTNWKWNSGGWYKVDTSVLAVSVIVKTNNEIATIYPAFINKDHLEGDSLNVGTRTKTHGYVINKMLIKNL